MKNKIIDYYKTIIFDCDGVIFNSNKIKTDGFYETTKKYGEKYAKKLVQFHINNGGMSRYKKYNYFFTKILNKKIQKEEFDKLLNDYSLYLRKELISCDLTYNFHKLIMKLTNKKLIVVSGGQEEDLKQLFSYRKIDKYFKGSIFGSPLNKEDIFKREIKNNNILFPAIYLGDSKYDYESSIKHNIDFIFVNEWTEMVNWKEYCFSKSIFSIKRLYDLVQ